MGRSATGIGWPHALMDLHYGRDTTAAMRDFSADRYFRIPERICHYLRHGALSSEYSASMLSQEGHSEKCCNAVLSQRFNTFHD